VRSPSFGIPTILLEIWFRWKSAPGAPGASSSLSGGSSCGASSCPKVPSVRKKYPVRYFSSSLSSGLSSFSSGLSSSSGPSRSSSRRLSGREPSRVPFENAGAFDFDPHAHRADSDCLWQRDPFDARLLWDHPATSRRRRSSLFRWSKHTPGTSTDFTSTSSFRGRRTSLRQRLSRALHPRWGNEPRCGDCPR
jgi:hypothetical protein